MMDTWRAKERCSPDAMTAYAEAACIGGHPVVFMGNVTMTTGQQPSLTTKRIRRGRPGQDGAIGRRNRRIGAEAVNFIQPIAVIIS